MSDTLGLLAQIASNYVAVDPNRAALCVAEEAGEFIGAYRRCSGQARRAGTVEEMEDELADVIIAAWSTAASLGVDICEAIERKSAVILERIA